MVEPFAKAAFTLPPYKVSDVVTTQFGHHLILVTERKPGKAVKYEEIKEDVKESSATAFATPCWPNCVRRQGCSKPAAEVMKLSMAGRCVEASFTGFPRGRSPAVCGG